MEKKINKAISYYLKYRHSFDHSAFKKEAANYFADSYEEYLILLNHLEAYDRHGKATEAHCCDRSASTLVIPHGCHYWGGQIRNNAQWRKQW